MPLSPVSTNFTPLPFRHLTTSRAKSRASGLAGSFSHGGSGKYSGLQIRSAASAFSASLLIVWGSGRLLSLDHSLLGSAPCSLRHLSYGPSMASNSSGVPSSRSRGRSGAAEADALASGLARVATLDDLSAAGSDDPQADKAASATTVISSG